MSKMTCLIRRIIRAASDKKIVIPEELWMQTWLGLRARGLGKVESAAIWGGRRDSLTETVEAVYFLDDYIGRLQRSGYHRVSVGALAELFAQLQRDRRVIVGDVHTHPSDWVGLSALDQENPIEYRKGLYAVVLPSYGRPSPSLSLAGVHVYEGDGCWRMLPQRTKKRIFVFT